MALSIEFGNPGKKYSVFKQAATCHQDMTTSMSPCRGLGRARQNKMEPGKNLSVF